MRPEEALAEARKDLAEAEYRIRTAWAEIKRERDLLAGLRQNLSVVEENLEYLRDHGKIVSLKTYKFIKCQFEHFSKSYTEQKSKVRSLENRFKALKGDKERLKEKFDNFFYHAKLDNKILYLRPHSKLGRH